MSRDAAVGHRGLGSGIVQPLQEACLWDDQPPAEAEAGDHSGVAEEARLLAADPEESRRLIDPQR